MEMNAITRWNPIRELDDLQNRVLRALYRRPEASDDGQQSLTVAEWSPVVDIIEDDKEYLIKAELPEVSKEDVKVTLDNGVVTIRGERKLEKEENHKKYHRIERSYGCFMRSFTLPSDADPGQIRADFKDGLLQVRLAKCEEKKPRQIDVNVD
jgi:HSP20 family protein